jgi:hypothetical protein
MNPFAFHGLGMPIPWFLPQQNVPGVAWHASGKRQSYEGRDSKGGKGKGNMRQGGRGGNKGNVGKGDGDCNDFKMGRCSRGAACRFSHGGCESEVRRESEGRFTYYKASFIEDPWARLLGPVATAKQNCPAQAGHSLGTQKSAAGDATSAPPPATVELEATSEPVGPECGPEVSIHSTPDPLSASVE